MSGQCRSVGATYSTFYEATQAHPDSCTGNRPGLLQRLGGTEQAHLQRNHICRTGSEDLGYGAGVGGALV
jgi:hypothetical protein